MNPYQRVISVVGRTLEAFDDDKLIPAYGFGDNFTTDKQCFPFFPDKRPCQGFEEAGLAFLLFLFSSMTGSFTVQ